MDIVLSAQPDVFGHNIETVERLYDVLRDRASYTRSMSLLEYVKSTSPRTIVKSGIMIGLGEKGEEVKKTLHDLSSAGCDIVMIGQYLRPSLRHYPVHHYFEPSFFEELSGYARELGMVAMGGPKVRSSYRAADAYHEAKLRRQLCV